MAWNVTEKQKDVPMFAYILPLAVVALIATGPPSIASETSTWSPGTMTAGNCQIKDMVVTLRSDGGGHFDSNIKTFHTHSGDYWHIRFVFVTQDQKPDVVIPVSPIE